METVGGENWSAISDLSLRGSHVEYLSFDFSYLAILNTFRGQEMKFIEEYTSLVVDATVEKSIAQQIETFTSEFNQACGGDSC
ncbi:hypothetical protein Bca4012_083166 [Brassica carinata]